ncbi:hypothetical protein SBA3_1780007 [Candidatus Sulfopaludibacter sp. SbA3]|nr:hypothetical protein SBA3_1780007 [Candidatus Sulfopaludibacter sp. SbA3]
MQEARYAQELKDSAEKRKQKPPSDEEIAKRFRESRASRLAPLGRIEVARGQVARGQKLLEEAWAANPNLVAGPEAARRGVGRESQPGGSRRHAGRTGPRRR